MLRRFSTTAMRSSLGTVNRVTLIGNVGKVPEIKEFSETNQIAVFPLATTETYKRQEEVGEYENVTSWHRIVVNNTQKALYVKEKIVAGTKVYVEGRIQYREYEKDGQKRNIAEVVVGGRQGEVQIISQKPAPSTSSS